MQPSTSLLVWHALMSAQQIFSAFSTMAGYRNHLLLCCCLHTSKGCHAAQLRQMCGVALCIVMRVLRADFAEENAKIMAAYRKKSGSLGLDDRERALDIQHVLAANPAMKRGWWFLETDLKNGLHVKMDNTGKSTLQLLRHLKRFTEVRMSITACMLPQTLQLQSWVVLVSTRQSWSSHPVALMADLGAAGTVRFFAYVLHM